MSDSNASPASGAFPLSSPTGRNMTLDAALRTYSHLLTAAGVDSPSLSAELLLAEAMGLSRQRLITQRIMNPDALLAPADREKADAFMARRAAGEPTAYILGRKEFFGREFLVTPATLIPRPETELLVETALDFAASEHRDAGNFADFGTGSGAIAVSLALELPAWQGLALDISRDALTAARHNAARLGAHPLRFLQADFPSPLDSSIPACSLDLLLANPPYVSETEYALLSPEIRLYEPRSALVPGACGTEHAAAVCREAARTLRPGGLLLMEMGMSQGDALLAMLEPATWRTAAILPDLAGLPRVVAARRR